MTVTYPEPDPSGLNHGGTGWQHFEHEADIGVRGYGDTVDQAFEQTALAMTAVVTEPDGVQALEMIPIEVSAPDMECLLVDWLNSLVYEMATRRMLFSRFEVEIQDLRLRARAYGEKVDRKRHEPAVEIKGATYTMLRVERQENGRWMAQCVVDV